MLQTRRLVAALLVVGLGLGTATPLLANAGNRAARSATAPATRALELVVVDPHGAPIQDFAYCVVAGVRPRPQEEFDDRAWPHLRCPGFPRRARSRDFREGALLLTGLRPGWYRVVVEHGGFARSISEAFELRDRGPQTRVTVQLTRGTTVEASVVDPGGKPVAGAVVVLESTNGTAGAPCPLFAPRTQKFEAVSLLPAASTRSNEDGDFRFDRVTGGKYRLIVRHPDFCHERMPVTVKDATEVELKPIKLVVGTRVHGTVTLDGRPAAGIRVTLADMTKGSVYGQLSGVSVPTPDLWSVRTNEQGQYTFPTRVPPSTYNISCNESGSEDDPFTIVLQSRESSTKFTTEPDTRRSRHDLAITSKKRR